MIELGWLWIAFLAGAWVLGTGMFWLACKVKKAIKGMQ